MQLAQCSCCCARLVTTQTGSRSWQGHTAPIIAPPRSFQYHARLDHPRPPLGCHAHLRSMPEPIMWQPSSFSVPSPGCHALTSHRCQTRLHSSPHSTGSPHRAAEHTSGQRLKQAIPNWTIQLTSRRCRGPYCGGDTLSSQSSGATRGKDVSPLPLMPASAKGLLPAGNWAGSPCRAGAGQCNQATPCEGRHGQAGPARCLCRAIGAGLASSCWLTDSNRQGSVCSLHQVSPLRVQLQSTSLQASARVAGLHFLH